MQRKQDYFDLEGVHPVSEDTLRKADPDYQIEVMKEWFFHNFEDPAQHTPYAFAILYFFMPETQDKQFLNPIQGAPLP